MLGEAYPIARVPLRGTCRVLTWAPDCGRYSPLVWGYSLVYLSEAPQQDAYTPCAVSSMRCIMVPQLDRISIGRDASMTHPSESYSLIGHLYDMRQWEYAYAIGRGASKRYTQE